MCGGSKTSETTSKPARSYSGIARVRALHHTSVAPAASAWRTSASSTRVPAPCPRASGTVAMPRTRHAPRPPSGPTRPTASSRSPSKAPNASEPAGSSAASSSIAWCGRSTAWRSGRVASSGTGRTAGSATVPQPTRRHATGSHLRRARPAGVSARRVAGAAAAAVEHVIAVDLVRRGLLVHEPELLHHAAGADVVGQGEGDDVVEPEWPERHLHGRRADLGAEALAPARRGHEPAQLDLGPPVELGARQAAARDGRARGGLEPHVVAEAVPLPLPVELRELLGHLLAAEHAAHRRAHPRVGEHRRDRVEVARPEPLAAHPRGRHHLGR